VTRISTRPPMVDLHAKFGARLESYRMS
jgi:hypothetical protein